MSFWAFLPLALPQRNIIVFFFTSDLSITFLHVLSLQKTRLPSCFTKNNMDSPKNKSGCPKKHQFTFEHNIWIWCLPTCCKIAAFPRQKTSKNVNFLPKNSPSTGLVADCGLCPRQRGVCRGPSHGNCRNGLRRGGGYGESQKMDFRLVWYLKFGVYAHHMAFLGEKW